MSTAVIIGGTGYVGWKASQRMMREERFDRVVLADIHPPAEPLPKGVEFAECDVRKPFPTELDIPYVDWIFHFAAVHREPGHTFEEYFDTNLPGASNVTNYAERVGCRNIFFSSSIAVYGPTRAKTDESSPKYPISGYGISKLVAELIHERWQAGDHGRRLIICRPGVVYGPGDPGNILRMIKAVKKGFFFFPGKPGIYKSYAYVAGLLDSIEFTMNQDEPVIRYNYVQNPTEPLIDLVGHIEHFFGKKTKTLPLPLWLLVPAAHVIQLLTKGRSEIHPKRVRKAAMPSHVSPKWLIDHGFEFKYDFESSLEDWKRQSPDDF